MLCQDTDRIVLQDYETGDEDTEIKSNFTPSTGLNISKEFLSATTLILVSVYSQHTQGQEEEDVRYNNRDFIFTFIAFQYSLNHG